MKPAAKTTTPAGPHPEPLSRCARALDWLRRTGPSNSPGTMGLLAAGLLVTVLVTLYVKSQMEADARRDFVFACHEIQLSLDARLAANAQVLRAGAALFSAGTVSREEWRSFTQELQLERQLPGIQGLGFAQLVPRAQLPEHVQEIRREGFPDYQVTPAGERETYSAIIYIEPFSKRNLRAFGYDMLSEPVRRAAMERARDDANAVLSGKVILVQETDQDVQAGVLLYIPVYRHGLPIETIAQRRAAIQGWVYSPYRMKDLMSGILSGWEAVLAKMPLRVQVCDGDVFSAEALLYDSRSAELPTLASAEIFTELVTIDFAQHHWTLRLTRLAGPLSRSEFGILGLIALGGLSITVLLCKLRESLLNTRAEAKRLAEQLNERLTLATRAGGVGLFDYDVVSNSLVWDEQMYRLYGIPRNQFGNVYESWRAGLHPEDAQREDAAIQRAFRGEQEFDTAFRVIWPDGSIHYIRALAQVQRDSSGQPVRLIGTNWDVTAQKLKEEELQAKTALLVAQTNATLDGILVIDEQKKTLLNNQRFIDLFHVPQDILDEQDDAALLTHVVDLIEHPDQFLERIRFLYDHQNETSCDEIVFKSGMVLDRYSAPVLGQDGKYYGRLWTFHDITHRKQVEKELRLAYTDLERSNQELEQFAYVASHDLQEPLRMVSSYTQLLARRYQGQLDADAQEFIAFAVDGANRMQTLINDLLAYSRVGTQGKKFEPTDFAAALAQTLANLREAIKQSGAVVTHDPLPMLLADKSQMVSLLQNLIGNAIKFHAGQSPRIHLSAAPQEQAWVFGIHDNGIGIEPQYAERIFQIFERLHTREEYPGTGIGLAICKKIVERHAGRIWVESQLAKGSTFYFTIPPPNPHLRGKCL